jgi:hypothetical protein
MASPRSAIPTVLVVRDFTPAVWRELLMQSEVDRDSPVCDKQTPSTLVRLISGEQWTAYGSFVARMGIPARTVCNH